jgi:uncharacterized protein (TIGR03000 family)
MSRWSAALVAIGFFCSIDGADARGFHGCQTNFAVSAPTDGVGSGDWSVGYTVDFAYAAAPPGTIGKTGAASQTGTPTPPSGRPTTPPVPAPRLHVLLLVDDTNKDAGPANKAGAALFERTIRAGVPEGKIGTIETVSGAALTPERIKARILALGAKPQDTVIGFYTGAADFDEPTRSYILTPANGARISRTDLKDWFLNRGAALTVLLTDSPAFRVLPEMLPPLPDVPGSYSLETLLFRNRGSVDVHAAAATETAFPRDGEGGLFALALVGALRTVKADGPEPIWPALVDQVRAATDQLYVDYRKAVLTSDKVSADDKRVYRDQLHQTPTALTPLDRVKPAPAPPVAKPTNNPQMAEIIVRVPAGAKVFVEDRPTTSTGPERHFETADLQPGRTYTYSIRAELDRDGKVLTDTKKATVKAGEKLEVKFEWSK